MEAVRPYHLPGLQPEAFADATFGEPPQEACLRLPVVTEALLQETAAGIVDARDAYLAELPVDRVVDVIDAAVGRWLDPGYHLRRKAVETLPAVTGYSPAMLERGLPETMRPFRRDGLLDLLRSELGDPSVLDGAGRPSGPRLTTIVLAGNVPAVAVESLVHALLLKSACLLKASSRDPVFPALFAQSLAEVDPELGAAVAVTWWKGGTADLDRAALAGADAVIAYGGSDAIDALRGLAPSSARFVDYGPRISFAAVGRDALARGKLDELAAGAALDVSLFDQQGCVAPHAIYVERGGETAPLEFARALAGAMQDFERSCPRGRLTAEEAARIQQLRGAWQMRQAAGQGVALFESEGSTAWTVAYDEAAFELRPSCLNRVVTVVPVDDLARLPEAVASMGPLLQSLGLATSQDRVRSLAPALARAGVTRLCPIGRMQFPPATWRHDGRHNLLPLLRWLDVEG
ncbi:MAG: acyl-CoA reductase [Chloroflexi bacterium]|nr:acyl-CoA reductase [Chloroflexota bacterium]